MIARRLLRAAVRPLKRLARPLRLRWIDYQYASSTREIERLADMRDDLVQLEGIEHRNQVKLEMLRQDIEREAM
jgi:hypothetical protein